MTLVDSRPETRTARRRFVTRLLARVAEHLSAYSLLGRAAGGIIGFLSCLCGYLSIRFLWPTIPARVGDWVTLGPVASVLPGVVDTTWLQDLGIYVVRQPEADADRIVAIRAACTHLGCVTQWDASMREFLCPCHGSAFDLRGLRLRGPARRALEHCAIRIRGGMLQVNVRQTFRKELGGWDDPRSYAAVSPA